jgi:methyltransferase (TIGR00027 family)
MRDKPSRTAQSVAVNLLMLSYNPALTGLVPPEVVEPTRWFLQAIPGTTRTTVSLIECSRLVRALLYGFYQRTNPGLVLHNGLRKRWIEGKVRADIAAGCSQIVVLAAGFDTLAYRLHRELPQTRWWEIDHPATQRFKRAALEQHGGTGDNLTLLPVDFTQQTLTGALDAMPDYDPRARSLFIIEGILMYLTETEVRGLLDSIHDLTGEGSHIIGTMMALRPDGRPGYRSASRVVSWIVRFAGEPFHWGLPPEAFPAFLQSVGFESLEVAHMRDMPAHDLPINPATVTLPEGGYFFLAKR